MYTTETANMNASQKINAFPHEHVVYLKVWPIHGHVNTISVRPPFQILLVVCIIYCMIEFFIDLRKTVTKINLISICLK
jgi:hypothetical protein